MTKSNGKPNGRISSIPPMREPLPDSTTQPEIPRNKALPPPPPPNATKLRGSKADRTRQALQVIWATIKLIWKVWTK